MPCAIVSIRGTTTPRYMRPALMPSSHIAHHRHQAQEQLKELNHHHNCEIIYIWHDTTDSFSNIVSLEYSVACTTTVIIPNLLNEGIHLTSRMSLLQSVYIKMKILGIASIRTTPMQKSTGDFGIKKNVIWYMTIRQRIQGIYISIALM